MNYQGFISATSKQEAKAILGELLKKHLVAGGFIVEGESNHWWKGKIDREPYCSINVFTRSDKVDKIIEIVEKISKDDTPVVNFVKIEKTTQKTQKWLDDNLKEKNENL